MSEAGSLQAWWCSNLCSVFNFVFIILFGFERAFYYVAQGGLRVILRSFGTTGRRVPPPQGWLLLNFVCLLGFKSKFFLISLSGLQIERSFKDSIQTQAGLPLLHLPASAPRVLVMRLPVYPPCGANFLKLFNLFEVAFSVEAPPSKSNEFDGHSIPQMILKLFGKFLVKI